MKVTSKTIKTLHLQREQVDKNIKSCVMDMLNSVSKESMESFNSELSSIVHIVEWAAIGEYAKICQDGFTMFLLNSEEMTFVEDYFYDKQRTEGNFELNLEIYDEEVFIDRVVDSQIQY